MVWIRGCGGVGCWFACDWWGRIDAVVLATNWLVVLEDLGEAW